MCGRYTLSKKEHLEQMVREAGFVFDESSDIRLVPRFNIAPSQQIPVILDEAPKTITSAKWGLISSWAKASQQANKTYEALAGAWYSKAPDECLAWLKLNIAHSSYDAMAVMVIRELADKEDLVTARQVLDAVRDPKARE